MKFIRNAYNQHSNECYHFKCANCIIKYYEHITKGKPHANMWQTVEELETAGYVGLYRMEGELE